jgi:hypothetical protein
MPNSFEGRPSQSPIISPKATGTASARIGFESIGSPAGPPKRASISCEGFSMTVSFARNESYALFNRGHVIVKMLTKQIGD